MELIPTHILLQVTSMIESMTERRSTRRGKVMIIGTKKKVNCF